MNKSKFEDPRTEIRFWKTICFLLLEGIRNDEFRKDSYKEDTAALIAGLL